MTIPGNSFSAPFAEKFGIGQPVRRKEDQRLLRGGGRYTDDLAFENQLALAFTRSPHAHARIVGIDTSAAESAPGVVAVFTGRDLAAAGLGRVQTDGNLKARDGSPMYKTRRLPLPDDKVRFVGEPVAMVIAETAHQARDAAEMILVDFETLPAVVTAEQALDPQAPALHDDCPGNCVLHWENDGPEAYEAARAKAHKVVSIRLRNNRVAPVPMEPKVCIGAFDGKDGRLTLYAPSQGGRRLLGAIADVLFDGDKSRVRHVVDNTGGGFGTRSKIYPEYLAVGYAAKALGRTVKWQGDRSETFFSDWHGRDQVNTAEGAFAEDGKLLGLKVETLVNIGAWVTENGARLAIEGGGRILGGCYDVPVLYFSCRNLLTNTVPTDTYRGAGRPEANYIMERLMQKAAKALEIDPLELRKRNYMTDFPYATRMGLTVDSGDFAGCLDSAVRHADWQGFPERRKNSASRRLLRGIGAASFLEGAGGAPQEVIRARLEESGRLTIFSGTYSHGQGHGTVYAQIVSERMGLPFDQIDLIQGDSDTTPDGAAGTFGSRSSQMGGVALIRACDALLEKGRTIAAHLLQADPGEVTFDEGAFRTATGSISLAEIAKAAHDPDRLPEGLDPGLDETYTYTRPGGRDDQNYPNGAHVCEVEIDPETGVITILGFTAVDDCGTVLNPLIVHGQVHGGVAQGIGQAMTENLVYDEETGQLLTGSFMDYGMPRAHDLPEIEAHFHPVPSTTNDLGVKGAGEAGCCGAPPALVLAVLDALAPLGITHIDMPLTPDRVWRTIHQAIKEGAALPWT